MEKKISLSHHEAPFFNHQLKQKILNSCSDIDSNISFNGKVNDFETSESLKLIASVWKVIKKDYAQVIWQREKDRHFIDQRCRSLSDFNSINEIDVQKEDYQTVIGLKDENDRIVFGPKREKFYRADTNATKIELPCFLDGYHVTLFGPPGKEKMCINAMNAFHRKHPDEPPIIDELLQKSDFPTKWGADDEDSKTPLHEDLVEAGRNLKGCYEGNLSYQQGEKSYTLEKDKLLQPIKRIPGLALPSTFLFVDGESVPLHLYDFVLHLYHHNTYPERLAFYIPKLENDEEARYVKRLIEATAKEIKKFNPDFDSSWVRLFIVLENPRAIFRLNEIIDVLTPNFAGASLGWHDFLASAARLFKEDPNYRIPVKADPNIVIKYIKASHELVAEIVGNRGGIPIGGMYGILPLTHDLASDSYQLTLLGFFKDVITQLKRGLKGFWVAHPDFIRLGQALTIAYEEYREKDSDSLFIIFKDYLRHEYFNEIKAFVVGEDVSSLDPTSKKFARSLIVTDIKESTYIANNDPKEIEYNIFQSLQYLTDWLCGNGCVALPAQVGKTPVRVMDDLATAERSRWELWHEINHHRFDPLEFIKLCHQEMNFIRKGHQTESKITQVKYSHKNAKWYKVVFHLLLKVVLDKNPPEFLPELLLPFTIDFIQASDDPWSEMNKLLNEKYRLNRLYEKYSFYFEMCGEHEFAKKFSSMGFYDSELCQKMHQEFSIEQLNSAASYHGDIGQKKETLDDMAVDEQAAAKKSDPDGDISRELLERGIKYKDKFGFKFLVSAKGKSSPELLSLLKERSNKTIKEELTTAKEELFKITDRRVKEHSKLNFCEEVELILSNLSVGSFSLSISTNGESISSLNFSQGNRDGKSEPYIFQMASLSKTVATYFCLNYFADKDILIDTSVIDLLKKYKSEIQIEGITPELKIRHLMSHSAMNMHYVNGIPADQAFPTAKDLLLSPKKYSYETIRVQGDPGKSFQYSGGGFILLEYLIGLIHGNENIFPLVDQFLKKLGCKNLCSNSEVKVTSSFVAPHNDKNEQFKTRLRFPSFAAGMYSHPEDVMKVLQQVYKDFNLSKEDCLNNKETNKRHTLARQMLHGQDFGSVKFMHAKAALGTFIIEGDKNYFMIHQGANNGYRSFYLYCIKGPNSGFGFCLFSTGEEKSVLAVSKVAQLILEQNNIQGIDFTLFKAEFNDSEVSQEEKVNRGYKDLFLKAFLLETAPAYPRRNFVTGDLEKYNLIKSYKILRVTDQKFAPGENLLSPYRPEFDPTLFCEQGKVMDSWESSRHSIRGYEELIFSCDSIEPHYAFVSTEFHDGNHVESVSIYASHDEDFKDETNLLEKVKLQGNAHQLFKLNNLKNNYSYYKVKTYPDGGLTRLKFFDENFTFSDEFKTLALKPKKCSPIPIIHKGYTLPFKSSEYEVVEVSNEHYSQASSILSDYLPLDMFDGGESARSRKEDNFESIKIKFLQEKVISKVLFDFKFFVNNNPMFVSLLAEDNQGNEKLFLDKELVKPYRGNFVIFEINTGFPAKFITLKMHPDGGINRLKFL